MLTTTVTLEGNLADDPQIRFTPSGAQITEFTILVNRSRQDEEGAWIDEEPTRHVCKAFHQLGENIAESLGRGDRALIFGNMVTDAWSDKQTSEKRTRPVVLVDAIGPSLRYATARPQKVTRQTSRVAAPHLG